MKSIFLCVILLFASNFSNAGETCKTADVESLVAAWIKFRDASLSGKPEDIAKLYEFPVRLFGPYDDSQPLLISRVNFLKKYDYIFREIQDLRPTYLFSDLKNNPTFIPKIGAPAFDSNGCFRLLGTPSFEIRSYKFIWRRNSGWKVVSATVNEDFSYLEYDGYPLGKK